MMIRPAELAAIKAGTIDVAFRRWAKPRVVVGTRMRTAVGLLEVTSVEQVGIATLRADDARRAGAPSLIALKQALAARPEDPAWRIGLVYAGPDPREALRTSVPDADEIAAIMSRLDRLDASSAYGAVDPGDTRPDRPQSDRPGPRPRRPGRPGDRGLQEGRPQAEGARAHRVAGDRLPAVAARRGRRRRRTAGAPRAGAARHGHAAAARHRRTGHGGPARGGRHHAGTGDGVLRRRARGDPRRRSHRHRAVARGDGRAGDRLHRRVAADRVISARSGPRRGRP